MDAAEAPVVGIDLGTTKFCVGVFRQGKVEIVPNKHGNRTTPTYVAFTDSGRLIGEEAKDQLVENHQNTVFSVNRLIGWHFENCKIQAGMKRWPFQVVNDQGKPKIQVSYMGEEKTFFPVEIYSMMLRKMKESAEVYVGKAVTKAVLTIPASFTGAQRQAVKDGATLAGLDVLYLVEEPTAAAIAYALEKQVVGPKNVLIINLGGGTVGVSIVTIDHGSFGVQSTAGNTHLGGLDFDESIVKHAVGVSSKVFRNDVSTNKLALCRLRIIGERAKCTLSSSDSASMESKSLTEDDGGDFNSFGSRDWFEELNEKLFKSTLKTIKEALKDAKMNKAQIDEIVLVGGSSDIPKVRELIQDFFNGKELYHLSNPVEAAAYGATVLSAVLQGDKSLDVTLTDVAPVSLFINMEGGESSFNLIKRNERIPTKIVKKLFTSRDNQSKMVISVYEGERANIKDSFLFRQFQLTGIPRAPSGFSIEITFVVDQNFCLDVVLADKSIRVTELTNNNYQ